MILLKRPTMRYKLASVVALATLCRCSPPGPAQADAASAAPTLLERRQYPGLEMRILLSRDTIRSGSSVEALYLEQGLRSGDTTVRKLLIDGRFAK